jgi:ATP-dependent DNA helicase UvrD/PcrA
MNNVVPCYKLSIASYNPWQSINIMVTNFKLRSKQKEILAYTHGMMGISAVPGSGKTWTLSFLAADLLKRGVLLDDQEILIVTLVNSAVDNFYNRISSFIEARGLIPNIGYRVRTLHGLAHDIVRERPELVQLDTNFQIIDEREADSIRDGVARAWLQSHPGQVDEFLDPELDESKRDWVKREKLAELVKEVALSFIRFAKDHRFTPEHLWTRLKELPIPLPLAEMGLEMYQNYQNALAYRGAVDFDDLIRHALSALEQDADMLERLRHRWPFILEDEAQDSSLLQEAILSLLSGEHRNWVRVGDPNQAIYETFTTASPEYLRDFLTKPSVIQKALPNSGRSTQSLIELANHLVLWTNTEHPNEAVRDALQSKPLIEPTPSDDPQPNPPDEQTYIHISRQKFTPSAEVQAVAESLERWLPDHMDATVAVLAPRNQRAFDLVDELRRRGIPYHDDFLRSSSTTRFSAGSLGHILRFLVDPTSAAKLSAVYRVWKRDSRQNEAEMAVVDKIAERLRKIQHVEDYIWPVLSRDWLEDSDLSTNSPEIYEQLVKFRQIAQRWQSSVLLPIDQLVLTLAQDLLTDPAELAVAFKLAIVLGRAQEAHPDWRMSQLSDELVVIAKNERRFLGFSDSDTGFEPEKYKGKVVLSTMHKAKGLEWDRVYLMSVNNYDFPSGSAVDPYISEKWFIRNKLNIDAEALAQLKALMSSDEYKWYEEGSASLEARQDYARERLRLLYVGITRAKKELIVTWNDGRRGEALPAQALTELSSFMETKAEVPHDLA